MAGGIVCSSGFTLELASYKTAACHWLSALLFAMVAASNIRCIVTGWAHLKLLEVGVQIWVQFAEVIGLVSQFGAFSACSQGHDSSKTPNNLHKFRPAFWAVCPVIQARSLQLKDLLPSTIVNLHRNACQSNYPCLAGSSSCYAE